MNDEKSMPYIQIYRASKSLKYDHAKPLGAIQVVYCIVSVLVLILLQNSLFSTGGFQLWGQSPNLILVFVYVISVKCKPSWAMALGLLSGLTMDIFFGRYVGFYAVFMLYIGFAVSLLAGKMLNTKWKILAMGIPLFLAFRILESLAVRILSLILGGGQHLYTDYWQHFAQYILPNVLFNELCLAAMIFPVYILWRRCSPH